MSRGDLKPPPFSANPKHMHKFRFLSTSAVTNSMINSDYLIGICGGTATTTSNVACRAVTARIVSVELWSAVSPAVSSTATIQWMGINTPNTEVSDTSFGSAYPVHLKSKPPKNALAGFWTVQGVTQNLFRISAPSSTVIDVVVEWVEATDAAGVTNYTVAGATIGYPYYGRLDSYTGVFAPVGVNSL